MRVITKVAIVHSSQVIGDEVEEYIVVFLSDDLGRPEYSFKREVPLETRSQLDAAVETIQYAMGLIEDRAQERGGNIAVYSNVQGAVDAALGVGE